MNTSSHAMSGSATGTRMVPVTQSFYWSVRRELWENRSIYVAPLAVGCVVLFGFLIATIGRALSITDLARRRAVLEEPYGFTAGLIMATTVVVGIFYSLDALHGERRDRSILFWKSMPVSDLTTVLAKLSVPLVVLPLFGFAITVATQSIMLLLSSMVMLANGIDVGGLWVKLFKMLVTLLYHLLTVHALWYAPIYAWMLLVSAWARRLAFLWAALPLVAIGAVERVAFNTSRFIDILQYRLTGPASDPFAGGGMTMHQLTHLHPGQFLATPGLWTGLVLAAIFLWAAVQLRRSQGPI